MHIHSCAYSILVTHTTMCVWLQICVYECVYVYINMFISMYIYTYMHVCMHMRVWIFLGAGGGGRKYTRTHLSAFTCEMWISKAAESRRNYTCDLTCAYIHTHLTHVYTHTHLSAFTSEMKISKAADDRLDQSLQPLATVAFFFQIQECLRLHTEREGERVCVRVDVFVWERAVAAMAWLRLVGSLKS